MGLFSDLVERFRIQGWNDTDVFGTIVYEDESGNTQTAYGFQKFLTDRWGRPLEGNTSFTDIATAKGIHPVKVVSFTPNLSGGGSGTPSGGGSGGSTDLTPLTTINTEIKNKLERIEDYTISIHSNTHGIKRDTDLIETNGRDINEKLTLIENEIRKLTNCKKVVAPIYHKANDVQWVNSANIIEIPVGKPAGYGGQIISRAEEPIDVVVHYLDGVGGYDPQTIRIYGNGVPTLINSGYWSKIVMKGDNAETLDFRSSYYPQNTDCEIIKVY